VLLYTFAALTKEVQLYCRSNAGIADLRHTFEGESYPFITLFIGFKRDVAFGLQKPIIVWGNPRAEWISPNNNGLL
jgi:hypothetical protein